MIDIVLVEDNDVFREVLELTLGLSPDIRVVGATGDGREALTVCSRTQPDVVVMDYRLPGLDGVEATAGVKAVCPEAAVVVLTASADREDLDALAEAGAVTCLSKDRGLVEIVGAIRKAAGRRASLV